MTDITLRRPINWVTGSKTDRGMVREVNEDALLVREDIGLWAVADGLGGHAVGDVASKMLTESLSELVNERRVSDIVEHAEDQLILANERILEYTDIMLDNATMGSTVVSLIIRDRVGICLWVGDSRLYRLRNNELRQLSRDHSQVQEWIDQGLIRPEEGENHPQGNVITRAVGVDQQLYVDVTVFDTQVGDSYLLCSDGLYNVLDRETMSQCLAQPDPQGSVDQLMSLALGQGAPDNVSIVVVKGEAGRLARGA